jgi:chromosome segregation ATPase
MSDEIREKINSILTKVGELNEKEKALQAGKGRHLDLINASEAEIQRCDAEIAEVRINVKHCKDEMEETHRKLFGEESAPAAETEASDEEPERETAAKKLWREQVARNRKMGVA